MLTVNKVNTINNNYKNNQPNKLGVQFKGSSDFFSKLDLLAGVYSKMGNMRVIKDPNVTGAGEKLNLFV